MRNGHVALRGQVSCLNLDPNQFGRGKEREGGQRREREIFLEREALTSL